MPSGRKEKDVLAKQKQLAALMAAKRKPNLANSNTSTRSDNRGSSASTSSSTAANKRPRIRSRSSKNSSVIDLTEDKNPSPSGKGKSQEKQIIMGIHKSFKRQSPSFVMAAARAKALKEKQEKLETDGTTNVDNNEKTSHQNKGGGGLKSKKKTDGKTDEKDNVAKKTSKRRLVNLVQNVAAISSGNKEDWLSASAASSITPDDFWKNIRKWDLVAQLANLQLDNRDNSKEKDKYCKVVPDKFINARHYVSVWAPLCLAECRAQLLSDIVTECGQMRGGHKASPFILVNVETTWKTGRNNKRDAIPGAEYFSDITDSCQVILKIPESEGRSNQYSRLQFFPHDICCLVPVDKKDVVENLLFRGNSGGGRQAAGQNRFAAEDADSEVFKHACIVGHTETHRREVHGLILKISKRKWAQVGSCRSGGKSGSGAQMYLLKIGCNITALREFTALSCVDTLPLKHYLLGKQIEDDPLREKKGNGNSRGIDSDKERSRKKRKLGSNASSSSKDGNTILDPRRTNKDSLIKMMGGVEALGKGFTEYAIKKFNPSQLMAICASSQGYGDGGFTLIKGPPGTGKTTTLVNILNALHIRQFNKYYDEVRKIVAIQTGNRQTALEIARRAKPRLLVCAPSNAAVDNVILKIMEDGFIDGSGCRYNPSITRIGVGKSEAVKDVALETKVDQILTDNSDVQQLENSIAGYRMELQRITTDIVKCRKKIHVISNASPWPLGKDWEIRVEEENFDENGRVFFVNHKDHTTTYECPPPPEPGEKQFYARSMPEYRAFMSRTVKLVESYFTVKSNLEQSTIVKGSMGNGARHFEVKQNLEMHVLNSVHIVMTTLGTAGGRALSDGVDKFEVVVIDEAAQSVEPASLAAMQLGSRHCVMVGDPQQLPATIFNVSGKNSKYDRSLFQRLEEAGEKVYMLNEQYRMHPKISHFPRHIFYKGALKDGPNVREAQYGNPLVKTITSRVQAFQPFTVLDLDSKEERGGTSLSNSTEADLAIHLFDSLKEISNGLSTKSRIAVITPYSQQANLLRKKFGDLLGKNYTKFVEVNTVDAFQGREANIVIFSAVRAAGSRGIGFLSDVRRMNVALTRAKNFLFVIARCKSIIVNPYWKDLVEHAHDTNAVVSVPILRKFKKGKTRFGPIHEWKRKGDASSQRLPAQGASFKDPTPTPHEWKRKGDASSQRLPAQGASFKDQLKFFQSSSNTHGGSNTPAQSSPAPQAPSYFPNNAPPISPNGLMNSSAFAPQPLPKRQPYFQNNAPPVRSNNHVDLIAPAPPMLPPQQPVYSQINATSNNFNNVIGPSVSAPLLLPPQPHPPIYSTINALPNNFNNIVGPSVPPPPPPPPHPPFYPPNNGPPNSSNNFAGPSVQAPPPPPPPPPQQESYFPNNAPQISYFAGTSLQAPPSSLPHHAQSNSYLSNPAFPNTISNNFIAHCAPPPPPPPPQLYTTNPPLPTPPNFTLDSTGHVLQLPPPPLPQPSTYSHGTMVTRTSPPSNPSDPRKRTLQGNMQNNP